jgi:hypothetical protein
MTSSVAARRSEALGSTAASSPVTPGAVWRALGAVRRALGAGSSLALRNKGPVRDQ